MKDIYENPLALGEHIRMIRRGKNISSKNLAKSMKVTVKQIYDYERGKNITMENLLILAEKLNINIIQLFNYSREKIEDSTGLNKEGVLQKFCVSS